MGPRSPLRTAARVVSIAFVVAICGSCTLIYGGKSKDQCSTDQDCLAKGPDFADTFCNDQKVCVISTSFCKTNLECITRNNNQPFICQQTDHTCVSLFDKDGDCQKILGADPPYDKSDLANDGAVIFGTLNVNAIAMGVSPVDEILSKSCQDSIDIARKDFHDELGGLGQGRPLLFVACNEHGNGDTTLTERAANFLIQKVHVPAIIGPFTGQDSSTVGPKIVAQKIVDLLPVATSKLLDGIPNRQYMFNFNSLDIPFATGFAAVMSSYLEPTARMVDGVAMGSPIKVVVAHSDDPQFSGTTQEVLARLTFNGGKSTSQEIVDGNFRELPYKIADTTTQANAVTQMQMFQPHVVIFTAGPESVQMMTQLEKQWSGATYRPYYMHHIPTIGTQWPTVIASNGGEALRKRVLGMNAGALPGDPLYLTFASRYAAYAAENDPATFPNVAGAACFDAAYVLGIAALGVKGALTPDALVQSIRTTTQKGMPYDINQGGTSFLQNVVSMIQSNGGINFQGPDGPVDFDMTGNAYGDGVNIYCIDPTGMAASPLVFSGLAVDPKLMVTGAVNKMTCGF